MNTMKRTKAVASDSPDGKAIIILKSGKRIR